MSIKPLIKVPLVLMENIIFSLFPKLRPIIERYFFNPLDFKSDHIEYSRKKFKEFQTHIGPYAVLKDEAVLELGPGGSIGFGLLALENGATKYVAIDDGTHTFIEKNALSSIRIFSTAKCNPSNATSSRKEGGSPTTRK